MCFLSQYRELLTSYQHEKGRNIQEVFIRLDNTPVTVACISFIMLSVCPLQTIHNTLASLQIRNILGYGMSGRSHCHPPSISLLNYKSLFSTHHTLRISLTFHPNTA